MDILWIVLIAAATFVALSLILAYVFSGIVIHSRRQPIVRTPEEYGMVYEDVSFPSTDGLTLKGWFIPRPEDSGRDKSQVIIIPHPLPFNRHGFIARNQGFPPLFRTDVDLLKTAAALHEAGYPVLMFDLRNHGESDAGITADGRTEYQDVLGAIAYVEKRWGDSPLQIGFVAFCMGAASTMIALSEGKDQVENVRFLVAIQPISADVFFRSYMCAVYTPLSLYLIPIVDRIVQMRGGYPLYEMSPRAFAKNIQVPTLYIQAKEDPWTNLRDIQGFYQDTAGPKELWLIEGEMRRFEAYNYVGEHPERILAFAEEHFS